MRNTTKSCIVVLAVMLLLPVAATGSEQLAESFSMQVVPDFIVLRAPCPKPIQTTLNFENTGTETISINWTSIEVVGPGCVTNWEPRFGTVEDLTPGAPAHETITYTLDCGQEGRTEIEFIAVIPSSDAVMESDTVYCSVTIMCCAKVPSHTNVGLVILILLLLGSGVYIAYRRRARTT